MFSFKKNNEIKGEMVYQIPNNFETYPVVFLPNRDGDEMYARTESSGEYYPFTGQFARDRFGRPRYAVTNDGALLYPRDENNNEYFLKYKNDDYIYNITGLRYPRQYISKNGGTEEIYPIKEEQHNAETERIEYPTPDFIYALGSDGLPKYPLGFSGNEYYFLGRNHPHDYPISHDGFYLVPFDQKTDQIINIPSSNITIKKTNLLKKIPVYKDNKGDLVYHYLTDIKAKKKPRVIRTVEPAVITKPKAQTFLSKLLSITYIYFLLIGMVIAMVVMWYWRKFKNYS